MIVLDTNVISEMMRLVPDPVVLAWVDGLDPALMFTTAVCEAEIRYGLARLPAGRRRDDLAARFEAFLAEGFAGQVLPFDGFCAAAYGEIRAGCEFVGRPMHVEDALIAATARAHGATLATRNVRDFLDCGVAVINPWVLAG